MDVDLGGWKCFAIVGHRTEEQIYINMCANYVNVPVDGGVRECLYVAVNPVSRAGVCGARV